MAFTSASSAKYRSNRTTILPFLIYKNKEEECYVRVEIMVQLKSTTNDKLTNNATSKVINRINNINMGYDDQTVNVYTPNYKIVA